MLYATEMISLSEGETDKAFITRIISRGKNIGADMILLLAISTFFHPSRKKGVEKH